MLEQGELVGEFMLNALRLNEGFTWEQFVARTGLHLSQLEPQLDALSARDLLAQDNIGVRATELGRRFLDNVVAEFFPA